MWRYFGVRKLELDSVVDVAAPLGHGSRHGKETAARLPEARAWAQVTSMIVLEEGLP